MVGAVGVSGGAADSESVTFVWLLGSVVFPEVILVELD